MHRRMLYISSVAAILVFMIGIAWLWQSRNKPAAPEVLLSRSDRPEESVIQGVILSLADGRQIDLSKDSAVLQEGRVVVRNRPDQELVYTALELSDTLLQYNELKVPRGGEYKLVLSDGTRVWINSETRLTYPVFFGDKREVCLEGEAYFEVTHDRQRPFIVHSGEMNITVLGTEFNVNSYDHQKIHTVLVKGRVQVGTGDGNQVILKPGELAALETGRIAVSAVNVRKYTAWRYGEFYFEDAPLSEIMDELARWYGIQIVYQNPALKQRQFSGVLKRSESVTEILKKIEQTTSVHFGIRQQIVSVQ